jgi:hypothetical protein
MSIDGVVARRSISNSKLWKEMRSLQNVDVVGWSGKVKKTMSNPRVLWGNSFKHNSWTTMMIGVHPMPSSRALLPPPVHAIQDPNHTRPMSLCIVCYQPYCVLLVGRSEVLCTKNLDQDFGKHPHPLECGIFSNSKILINVISSNVVCNHSHDSGYFFIQTKS